MTQSNKKLKIVVEGSFGRSGAKPTEAEAFFFVSGDNELSDIQDVLGDYMFSVHDKVTMDFTGGEDKDGSNYEGLTVSNLSRASLKDYVEQLKEYASEIKAILESKGVVCTDLASSAPKQTLRSK